MFDLNILVVSHIESEELCECQSVPLDLLLGQGIRRSTYRRSGARAVSHDVLPT